MTWPVAIKTGLCTFVASLPLGYAVYDDPTKDEDHRAIVADIAISSFQLAATNIACTYLVEALASYYGLDMAGWNQTAIVITGGLLTLPFNRFSLTLPSTNSGEKIKNISAALWSIATDPKLRMEILRFLKTLKPDPLPPSSELVDK